MNYSSMKLIEVCRVKGVNDIKPTLAKAAFAKALIAESKGDTKTANEQLEKACKLAEN